MITRHNQLHNKEIRLQQCTKIMYKYFYEYWNTAFEEFIQKIWPVDLLVFNYFYSRRPRGNYFTYDKLIVTASYWRNINSKTIFPLLENNRDSIKFLLHLFCYNIIGIHTCTPTILTPPLGSLQKEIDISNFIYHSIIHQHVMSIRITIARH